MNKHRFFRVGVLLLIAGVLAGCKPKNAPVFVGESEPENASLSFQKPETHNFEIAEKGTYSLGLEMTYATSDVPDGPEIPMYYILEGPGLGDGVDKKFTVGVKDVEGKWKGVEGNRDNERTVSAVFEKEMSLEAGSFMFKLYADSPTQGAPIPGILAVKFMVSPH